MSQDGPASETLVDMDIRRLMVRGQKYLTLTFATDGGDDEWRVAVVGSDPAVTHIVSRIHAALSESPPGDVPSDFGSGARIADAGTDEAAKRLWEYACQRHDDILGAYGAYELTRRACCVTRLSPM